MSVDEAIDFRDSIGWESEAMIPLGRTQNLVKLKI